MSKNFDDFVIGLEHDPDYRERGDRFSNEVVRFLANHDDVEDIAGLTINLIEDISLAHLRAYHEWLHP